MINDRLSQLSTPPEGKRTIVQRSHVNAAYDKILSSINLAMESREKNVRGTERTHR